MKKFLQSLTLPLLLLAISMTMTAQTVYQVAEGSGGIKTAYTNADSGDIIELTTSGGLYEEPTTITVTKNITIRAQSGLAEKPVFSSGNSSYGFQITGGGLTVEGIKFRGIYQGSPKCSDIFFIKGLNPIDSSEGGGHFILKIDNCEITNYMAASPSYAINVSGSSAIPLDSIIITNTVIDSIQGYGIYLRNISTDPGSYRYFKWENCLVRDITKGATAAGYAAYIQPANKSHTSYPEVFINHITIDSVDGGGIYDNGVSGAVVQNCIVTNAGLQDLATSSFFLTGGTFSSPTPPNTELSNCIYYNAPGSENGGITSDAQTNITNSDPMYTDAANYDYSLQGGSPGHNAGTETYDLGYIAAGLSSLPVEITSFSGEVMGNAISLSWKTATESNNYGFQVERKNQEKNASEWEKIGFVPGHGTSNTPIDYSYRDEPAQGHSFSYRLKQIDRDGRFKYYEGVNVVLTQVPTTVSMHNYPNPFNPSTKIEFTVVTSGLYSVKVFNAVGQQVGELFHQQVEPGLYSISFNASNYSSGLYFYTLQGNNVLLTRKMLLLK